MRSALASLLRLEGSRQLARDSVIAVVLRVIAALASFWFTVVVSQTLSLERAGQFFFIFSAISIGGQLGRGALPQVGLRLMASLPTVLGVRLELIRKVAVVCLVQTGVAAAVLGIFLYYFGGEGSPGLLAPSVAVLAALAVTPTLANLLRGLGDIVGGVLLDRSAFYLLSAATILLAVRAQTVDSALGAAALAGAGAVLSAVFWLRWRLVRSTPGSPAVAGTAPDDQAVPSTGRVLRTSLALLLMTSSQSLAQWYPQLALGTVGRLDDTALFAVSNKIAQLALLVLTGVGVVTAPQFARYARNRDARSIRRLYYLSSGITLLLSLPIFATVLAVPDFVLGLFGGAYPDAALTLRILMLGQLVNMATGSVGPLLLMAEDDRFLNVAWAVGALLLVVIGTAAAYAWGHVGAAVAMSAFLVLLNVVMLWRADARFRLLRFGR